MDDPGSYSAVYEANLRSRCRRNRHSRIARSALSMPQDQERIPVACSFSGMLQAGILTMWDDRAAYHLLATRTSGSDSSVIGLPVWKVLRHAVEQGRVFDVDGVGIPRNRLFFKGFGRRIALRVVVARTSMTDRVTRKVIGLLLPGAG